MARPPREPAASTWVTSQRELDDNAKRDLCHFLGFRHPTPRTVNEQSEALRRVKAELGWYRGAIQSGNASLSPPRRGRPRQDARFELIARLRRVFADHRVLLPERKSPIGQGAKQELSEPEKDEVEFIEIALATEGIEVADELRRYFFEPEVASKYRHNEQAAMRTRLYNKVLDRRKKP